MELNSRSSLRDFGSVLVPDPALKRWAKIVSPFGTKPGWILSSLSIRLPRAAKKINESSESIHLALW